MGLESSSWKQNNIEVIYKLQVEYNSTEICIGLKIKVFKTRIYQH